MSHQPINIKQLSSEEKLGLLERLWDSLTENPAAIPLTNVQREELDRRLDDLDREGPAGVPAEEALERIQDHGE